MAYPTVEARTLLDSYSGNDPSITLPSASVGDLYLILYNMNNPGAEFTDTDGFTRVDIGTAGYDHLLTKTVDGTEGATADFAVSAGWTSSALLWHISGWSDFEISGQVNGSNKAPDSPSLSPSWDSAKTLWISSFSHPSSPMGVINSYPSGFSEGRQTSSGNSTAVAAAELNSEIATVDPGVFDLASFINWYACTVAIAPAPLSGGGFGALGL